MVRLALALMLLGGCLADGEQPVPGKDSALDLTLLFHLDDCEAYRFYDAGNYKYIVKCPSAVSLWGNPR